jgi:hypothetical protein
MSQMMTSSHTKATASQVARRRDSSRKLLSIAFVNCVVKFSEKNIAFSMNQKTYLVAKLSFNLLDTLLELVYSSRQRRLDDVGLREFLQQTPSLFLPLDWVIADRL